MSKGSRYLFIGEPKRRKYVIVNINGYEVTPRKKTPGEALEHVVMHCMPPPVSKEDKIEKWEHLKKIGYQLKEVEYE